MIPKVIHYCWFGRGLMPDIAKKCIDSWKKYLPEYEVKLWNEDNFDINICDYTKEAYASRKYAFVSDYARLWILYNYGGVYFDTDVEIVASPKDILSHGPFMGTETNGGEDCFTIARCAPGLGMASYPGMPALKDLLIRYDSYHFVSPIDGSLNQKTIVEYTTEYLHESGFPLKLSDVIECCGFLIYPKDYFSPRSLDGKDLSITTNTISIHWFTNTWNKLTPLTKLIFNVKKILIGILPVYITKKILESNQKKRNEFFCKHFQK